MRNSFLTVVGLLSLYGCGLRPDSGELARDLVVQTQYDQSVISSSGNVFNTYNTFVIREDTIGFVSNRSNATYLIESDFNITGGYALPIISLAKQNLGVRGFTPVAEDDSPDFAVNIAVLNNFTFFQTITYPGFYPGYFGFYGYYFPIVNTYVSDYTTMVIEIVDIKNATGNQYRIVWKAFIGDLNTIIGLREKTLEAVDQAFGQSPYISKD
ncbi:MAG: DUF4136 domain-containing protein [Cyclobacteriaceae bacterium]|nr:DUF4136 domain-containing protein [Cyclobacteriaceae bacterium]